METKKHREKWAKLLRDCRAFLDGRGFTEVTTDYLVPAGAFESSIDAFTASGAQGSWQLHTSPEIEMKRLLAESPGNIYQIARCFRDDPLSPIHGHEFTLLEFYRVGTGYDAVMDDTLALMAQLSGRRLKIQQSSVAEIVEKVCGIQLKDAATVPTLRSALTKIGIEGSNDDSWGDLFFRLLLEKVEPALDPAVPTLLHDYPAAVSPLSQAIEGTPFAERFEIYWRGMELCNGCTELTRTEDLRRNWEKQNHERSLRGVPTHPAPERLFDALSAGLPPCSGVAIGLDRLFLALEAAR